MAKLQACEARPSTSRGPELEPAPDFDEAGLVDGNDPGVIASLGAPARGLKNDRTTEIGRQGERLTFEFETRRTGVQPKWLSIDTDADG